MFYCKSMMCDRAFHKHVFAPCANHTHLFSLTGDTTKIYRSCDQPAISSKCTKVFCQATGPVRGPVELSRRDCLFSALSALPVMMWTQRSSAESEDIPQYGPGIEAEQKTMKGVPFKAIVKRPPEAFTSRKNNQEEVLSIGLEVPRSKVTGFNVFINLPNADADTPVAIKEYVASHINLIGSGAPDSYRHTRLRVGIGDTIEDLGLSNASEILVTIVPRGAEKDMPVYVKGVHIETEDL